MSPSRIAVLTDAMIKRVRSKRWWMAFSRPRSDPSAVKGHRRSERTARIVPALPKQTSQP